MLHKFIFISVFFLCFSAYAQQVDIINEDFNDGFPSDWTHYYSSWGGEKWAIDSGALRENSGPYFIAVSKSIELPVIDLTSVSDPFLEFDLAMAVTDSNIQFSVYYTTDSIWSPLVTYTDNSTTIPIHTSFDNTWQPSATDYRTISLDLAQFENETSIQFQFVYDYMNAWASGVWYIDNVRIFGNSTTGISESNADHSFWLFPNPTSDVLNLMDLNDRIKEISIVDMQGKTHIYSSKNTKQLHVETLPKGVYLLQVQTENGWKHRKFVKK